MAKTAARHTGDEFVDFLDQVVRLRQPKQAIHIIVDNLSAHETKQVAEFLGSHPEVKLHFNADPLFVVESSRDLVRRIERNVIARGVFTSVKGLARKLMYYIRTYSKNAKPFRWKYSDVTKRIKPC